jgi:hypothetical protein
MNKTKRNVFYTIPALNLCDAVEHNVEQRSAGEVHYITNIRFTCKQPVGESYALTKSALEIDLVHLVQTDTLRATVRLSSEDERVWSFGTIGMPDWEDMLGKEWLVVVNPETKRILLYDDSTASFSLENDCPLNFVLVNTCKKRNKAEWEELVCELAEFLRKNQEYLLS